MDCCRVTPCSCFFFCCCQSLPYNTQQPRPTSHSYLCCVVSPTLIDSLLTRGVLHCLCSSSSLLSTTAPPPFSKSKVKRETELDIDFPPTFFPSPTISALVSTLPPSWYGHPLFKCYSSGGGGCLATAMKGAEAVSE